jgi:hypothetical protein
MMNRRSAFKLGAGALVAGFCGACAITFPLGMDLASVAERHVGKNARQLGVGPDLWCAEFADLIRVEAGYRPVRSRRAIDQVKGGRKIAKPVRGALMITRRGMRGHHVDVVAAVLPDGMVRVIGGNVDGAVRERVLPAKGIFVLPG